jgi:arsenate reductase
MAEGWINHLLGGRWRAQSAGTAPAARVHPLAVQAMAEAGVDISGAVPRHVAAERAEPWDLVVTVCDAAREACPVFPGRSEKLHMAFSDPASVEGSEKEKMAAFRRVRDEIRERLVPVLSSRSSSPTCRR